MKDDSDTSFALHLDEYPALKKAFMAGEAFFIGRDLYGDEVVIRLPGIVAISRNTPEAAAEFNAERKRTAAEEALE